jgi:DnaJ-class molecular chaperone
MNGKGSRSRPLSVDQETMAKNWERTFGGLVRNAVRDLAERLGICATCKGDGTRGYDRMGRPASCEACGGTGRRVA